jgi:hypothetical protein
LAPAEEEEEEEEEPKELHRQFIQLPPYIQIVIEEMMKNQGILKS